VEVPDELRYTEDHEWVRVEGDSGVVGITAYAAEQLGDIVFVELPAVGTQLAARQSFGVVESVKAVSDLYAPIAGEVTEANEALAGRPDLVNSDPYGEGWMLRLKLASSADADGLRDAGAYRELIKAG
jgi:glycine cleavage system H protein